MLRVFAVFVALVTAAFGRQPLVVLSIDGLDQRYLTQADQFGLRIPTLRQLQNEGQFAREGVVGVVPTVTWPSHTTLITGVDPVVHGILGNRRPKSEGGDYYWGADLIRTSTLLTVAHQQGLTAATVTWPVTVDASAEWNLPEYFTRRRGGAMDLRSIESRSRPPGLVSQIAAQYPSFAQEWMDDRVRALAICYLIEHHHPDLLLAHFVDLDSEEHDNAPFSREAFAVLEYTDQLIGTILHVLPPAYAVAVVSDHGFERVNRVVNVKASAQAAGVSGVLGYGGVALAQDAQAAEWLRSQQNTAGSGVGREVPPAERQRFPSHFPGPVAAMFESQPGIEFGDLPGGAMTGKPVEIGNHGHWPTRYRAVFLLRGPGIPHEELPELSMKDIAPRLARVLDLRFSPGQAPAAGQ